MTEQISTSRCPTRRSSWGCLTAALPDQQPNQRHARRTESRLQGGCARGPPALRATDRTRDPKIDVPSQPKDETARAHEELPTPEPAKESACTDRAALRNPSDSAQNHGIRNCSGCGIPHNPQQEPPMEDTLGTCDLHSIDRAPGLYIVTVRFYPPFDQRQFQHALDAPLLLGAEYSHPDCGLGCVVECVTATQFLARQVSLGRFDEGDDLCSCSRTDPASRQT